MRQPPEQDVKVRLLLAAKKLFARQGYEGTTIRQISKEAGANVALISYHFGGKDKIFRALFETFLPLDRMAETLQRPMDPVEGLRTMIREVTYFRLREPEMINLMQHEILLSTPRTEIIRGYTMPVWMKLRDLLEEGRAAGHFRFRSLDHTVMSVIGTVLFHKKEDYFAPLFKEGKQRPEDLIEDITTFVLNGLEYRPS